MSRYRRAGPLLERDAEQQALADGVRRAGEGDGGLVLVEGPAGIGKSSLLDACVVEAERAGLGVLRVRGDELVMESSFAAVRELFWAEVRAIGVGQLEGASALASPVFAAEPWDGSDRDRVSSVLYGLYWLTADLTARRPLAIVVDDAQWLDAASARFLEYLARRIDELPVTLMVALRAGEPSGRAELGVALAQYAARRLRPSPLSEEASGQVVRGVLGARADDALCRYCHTATLGNPFYLGELAAALEAEGGRPTVERAARVASLGPEAIGASVLVRLARLGDDCERLAEALAVLGPDSSLRHAAALAGLPREGARAAADRLHAAEVISAGAALSFVHPIVGEAVASQLPPARTATLHGQAARLLGADDSSTDRVAAHLLFAEPYGDEWVVDVLRAAAREALARGAPEAAVSCLRRARQEPPVAAMRVDVLVELGRAEALLPTPHDFTALREARDRAGTAPERAEIAYELALALFGVLRNGEAIAVLEDALNDDAALEDATAMRLESALIGGGIGDLDVSPRLMARAERYVERARSGAIEDPLMLSSLAQTAVIAGTSADEAATFAHRALQDRRLLTEWLNAGYVGAVLALCWSDRSRDAIAAIDAGMAEALRRGSAPMLLQLSYFEADAALRCGDLELAEGYAQRAFELGIEFGAEYVARMWLPIVLIERGRGEEAAEMLETVEFGATSDPYENGLLAHRGRVRVARGENEAGLADLLQAGRRAAAAGVCLSTAIEWVPPASIALCRLGRRDDARALVGRELREAVDYGAPRRHGLALAASASLDLGDAGLAGLRDAADILDRCDARLDAARVRVELGVRRHQRGERDVARSLLRDGLETAHDCGAWSLAERARAELVATGARPRRAVRTGPGALTPAELRAARMAAEGLSNRQIAQALFVSTKTIEGQLSQAYAKLGIRSRAELAAALGEAERSRGADRPIPV
jgi:DNA-binding CsgD family transcriptional regulator